MHTHIYIYIYPTDLNPVCTTLGVATVVVQRLKLTESYLRSNKIYIYCVGDWNWNTSNYFYFPKFFIKRHVIQVVIFSILANIYVRVL